MKTLGPMMFGWALLGHFSWVAAADPMPLDVLIEVSPRQLSVQSSGASTEKILDQMGARLNFDWVSQGVLPSVRNVSCTNSDLRGLLRCVLGETTSFLLETAEAPGQRPKEASSPSRLVVLGVGRPLGLKSLTEAGATQVRPSLALENPNPRRRSEALVGLLNRKDLDEAQVLETLKRAVKDRDPGVRSVAVDGLAPFEDPEALALVRAATLDGRADVRLAAYGALPIAEETRALYLWALKDPDPSVRALAGSRLMLIAPGPP